MKKIISGICVFCFCLAVHAQSSRLMIMDFSIAPVFNGDSSASGDLAEWRIGFKINRADSAFKAHVYLGTAKDAYDVRSVEVVFVFENGKYYTELNGVKNEIKSYAAQAVFLLSKAQAESFTDAALFIEKTNGQNTARLYFKK